MNRPRVLRFRGDLSGGVVSGTLTYASSLDPAITNLYARYCAPANLFGCPLLLGVHGYAEDASALTDTTLQRFAARGFFVLAPGMRGRNGASGARDASGRELFDLVDGVRHVIADTSLGPRIDPLRAVPDGYSGGGGNVLGLAAKFPDLFSYYVAHFGPSDYGFQASDSWYATNPAFQASLTTDVGAAPTAQPGAWKTRDHATALATQLALARRARGDVPLISLYHDADDASVSVRQSDRLLEELEAAGVESQLDFRRSTAASAVRYSHGYPDTSAGVLAAEEDWWKRARDASPWTIPMNGRLNVAGYVSTRRFTVFLGAIVAAGGSDPRSDASGGKVHCADLHYAMSSAESGSFTLAPITGPVRVRIEVGESVVVQEISSTTTITV